MLTENPGQAYMMKDRCPASVVYVLARSNAQADAFGFQCTPPDCSGDLIC